MKRGMDNTAQRILRMKHVYAPFTRWEVVEKLTGFGIGTLDEALPYCIDDPDEIVIATIPLTTAAYDHFDRVVGLGQSFRFVETMGFFVPTYPIDRTHVINIFYDVFHEYGIVIYDHNCNFRLCHFDESLGTGFKPLASRLEATILAQCLKQVLYGKMPTAS